MPAVTKAVVTVLGLDRKGIIAEVSRVLYECNVNILDISQTVISGHFSMILIADITEAEPGFEELANRLGESGKKLGVEVRIQRSEIFEAMHQV